MRYPVQGSPQIDQDACRRDTIYYHGLTIIMEEPLHFLFSSIKVHSFLKQCLRNLCLTLKSGTFTKTFSWCQLWLGWKVWWKYHFFVKQRLCIHCFKSEWTSSEFLTKYLWNTFTEIYENWRNILWKCRSIEIRMLLENNFNPLYRRLMTSGAQHSPAWYYTPGNDIFT